jgi:undecaprenyl-diphosphatase
MIVLLGAAGAVSSILFVVLGWWVTHHPLARIDELGAPARGASVGLAVALTLSGYGPALTVISAATIVAAFALRLPVRIPLGIVASQVASQVIVDIAKRRFDRARPTVWLYRRERGRSYPSGHAVTAVVFYGAWMLLVGSAPWPLPVRIAGVLLLGLWAAGICWSRVALGAHYTTDIAGGVLFGIGWWCLALGLTARGAGLFMRPA